MSAAERARLKKAAKGGGAPSQPQPQQQQQPKQQQQQQLKGQVPKGGGKPPAGPAFVPEPKGARGKKAKAAKAKEKYAEQDEEDRQLALQVGAWRLVGADGGCLLCPWWTLQAHVGVGACFGMCVL